ncbi:Transmembrane protein isoform 2 [Schistosoma japonicum]|uniref:Transmembrane protein isoform 2 n=2 Tax=Schistosoma japonicum TaxID=6182 RepID=A0A4Z2CT57_SCHJA|nr:Transmembrane protein 185B [Schistosoma japonicum]KAH8862078.1 Transmembrane protein 185B [Schistosoma japonicum]KAH8862079.1 Transmembrane protein 185B [Schistosoma japonicum]TNN07392.1 Transmembrane protein isoform 2 [Schistosoma japonicum]TNN07393.1 Transmembrane protein isoform 2 [Schistosoma japonicum]
MASFQKALENLNEGTICISVCVSVWLLLIAVRMDNVLIIPYWTIFLPLWLWKTIVFVGWLVGLIVWCRHWRIHVDDSEYNSFVVRDDPALPYIQAMSVSAFFHLLITCSEVLLCIHLSVESSNLTYLIILSPLLVVGALGVFGFLFVLIDSRATLTASARRRRQHHSRSLNNNIGNSTITTATTATTNAINNNNNSDSFVFTPRSRHVCSFTLELCIAANLLQLLFLIARLDNWIRSNWIVTFIPSFISLAMGFLFCFAGLTIALITYFTAFFIPVSQRRLSVRYYASHLLIVIFLCTSLILLGLRLDGYLSASKSSALVICVPVLFSMFLYVSLSSGPGNPWWFGLNRNVLLAIFESFPTLQLCVNNRISKTGLWRISRCRSDNGSMNNTLTVVSHNRSPGGDQFVIPTVTTNPSVGTCELSDSRNLKLCPYCSVGCCRWCSSSTNQKNIHWQNINVSLEVSNLHDSYHSDHLLYPD